MNTSAAHHLEGEAQSFAGLQARLPDLFRQQFNDKLLPRTIVVVPSLSFDANELAKITGVHHYEERMLCMLMLLRLPRTHVVYLSSVAIDPSVIDYHLHLLSGVPSTHARRRLHLFHTGDGSPIPLTQKLLARPRLLNRIRASIPHAATAHMTSFNATALERTLAVRLGIPLYGCDPTLLPLGTKSGSREVLREANVAVPDGFEHLRDRRDVAGALAALKKRRPDLKRAVVKLNEGFSGEGNALFVYPSEAPTPAAVEGALPDMLQFEAPSECWDSYAAKLATMGGIVECFIEGAVKRSPSVQCRINPLRAVEAISTHDQELGGPSGQVFLGCTFPADDAYRLNIQRKALRVAALLEGYGVLGRFGIDFVSVQEDAGWKHYGIEINLRKGGTTHPLMMLHFLTDGRYDRESALFLSPSGAARYYCASDNVEDERYKGLLPDDLIDIAVCNDLHFHGATQTGVVFHLISAISEFGKLGMVCIGATPEAARRLRDRTLEVLDAAVG